MSITAEYVSGVTANETLETSVPASTDPIVKHNGYDTSESLTATSDRPITKVAYFSQALTAGTATIDLTALTGTNGAAIDGSGLKVQMFKIAVPSGNANTYQVKVGAANGYDLMGANWDDTLQPGQEMTFFGYDATPDVAGADKTIDCVGTGSQAANITIWFG